MGFEILKHWEGYVLEPPEDDSVLVKLVDIGGSSDKGPDQVAELLLRRLPESELEWLRSQGDDAVGLVFDWKIFKPAEGPDEYADNSILFRRDVWTKKELDEVRRESEAYSWFFDGDEAGAPTEIEEPTCPEPDGSAHECGEAYQRR